VAAALATVLGQARLHPPLRADREQRIRVPRPPGPRLGAAQVTKMNLNGINLVPSRSGSCPSDCWPSRSWARWDGTGPARRGSSTSTSPLLAGKAGKTDVLESPDGVALPSTDASTPAQAGTGLELTLDESCSTSPSRPWRRRSSPRRRRPARQ